MAIRIPSPTVAIDRRQQGLRDDDTTAKQVAAERRDPAIDRDFERHGHHPDCYCRQCCLDRM